MLVKSNKEFLLTVKKQDGKLLVIMPGYNDFPDDEWNDVRATLGDVIAEGVLEEEWVKISPDLKDTYVFVKTDDKAMYAPASLKDLTRTRLKDVIKNTFSIDVLKKWLDVETRADVRLDIMKQLSALENKPENSYI